MAKNISTSMAEFQKDIQYLTQITESGFKEIHKRQDIANGKLLKHENQLTKLESMKENYITKTEHLKEKITLKDKVVFYLLGVGGTIFAGVTLYGISLIVGG